MDPLTITTGVLGILQTSGELIIGLYQLGTNLKEARSDADAVAKEVSNITVIVQGLQTFVLGRARAPPQRLQLITLEQIVATLTECILTYSELDQILKALHNGAGMNMWDRAMWLLKKERIEILILRLQNHKATFSMMLNILQSASMAEAERTMEQLCDSVHEVLRSNQELSLRLRNIEELNQPLFGAASVRTSIVNVDDPALPHSANSVTKRQSLASTDPISSNRTPFFEELLHRSRVYRHTADNELRFSLNEARSTLALSICSSLTLGEISNLSVFALPIYASELSNPEHYVREAANATTEAERIPYRENESPKESGVRQDLASRFKNFWLNYTAFSGGEHPVARKIITAATGGVFGVSLEKSVEYASVVIYFLGPDGSMFLYGYAPRIVAKCGMFILLKGTKTEDVFARSGCPARVRDLQTAFDSPPKYGRGLEWTGYTVHDVADLCLRYILELPEPIIPTDLYARFRDPLRADEMESALPKRGVRVMRRTFQELVWKLPPSNRAVLLYLLKLLAGIACKVKVNKMSAATLAALFQPGILDHPDDRSSPAAIRLSQDVLIYLIENRHHLPNDHCEIMHFTED